MAGRTPNPGEKDPFDLIDQRGVKNRTLRAQVTAVDNTNGFVTFNLEASPAGGKVATVAPLWASFPRGGGAAWGRFMPQVSDILKVAFDYDDAPRIVGYDIAAEKEGFPFGRVGWPSLAALHETANSNPSAKVTVTDSKGNKSQVSIAKYAQFIPLQPGEFDFMSSGGAYIYGQANGRLYMAGGAVSVSLNKNDLLIEQYAQCWTHHADDCTFRFGQVRRPDPADTIEKTLTIDAGGTYKEFSALLKTTQAPGVALDLASIQLGNVVVGDGQIPEKLDGVDLRFLVRAHNIAGIEMFSMVTDMNGNHQIDTKGKVTTNSMMDHTIDTKMNFTVNSLMDSTINATTAFTVNSPAIKFQGPQGAPPAIHPLILSQIYGPAEQTMVTGLVTQINLLTAQVAAISAALTAMGGAFIIEIPAGIALVSAMAPITGALGSLPAATTAVGTAFTGPYSTYLSQIAKTG